jgi:hypothetical protein
MKKLFSAFLILALFCNHGFAAWDGDQPAGSALISDIDTLIQTNNAALENTLGGLTGWQNLSVSYTNATTVTVTADSLYLQDAAGISYRATGVSEAIAITTSGASGLVASLSEASSTWYYVYIARKSTDGTTNGFLSTSSSLATVLGQLDSGYDQASLVSAVRNDGSSNFVSFTQISNKYWYSTWQTLTTGNVGLASWTAIDTAPFVPSGVSSNAFGSIYEVTGNSGVGITNDNTIGTGTTAAPNKHYIDARQDSIYWNFNIKTANTLYWISSAANFVYIAGFELNKI